MSEISREVVLGLAVLHGSGPLEGDAVDLLATELNYRLRRVVAEAIGTAQIEYRSRLEQRDVDCAMRSMGLNVSIRLFWMSMSTRSNCLSAS